MYKYIRPRRNRASQGVRALISETFLHPNKLVLPIFLEDGAGIKTEIKSLPGVFRYSVENATSFIEEALRNGISSFILFPAVQDALKDSTGTYSYHPDNFYLKAIRTLKNQFPKAVFISDVALDPYSSDGHDGIVRDGEILNDQTLEVLSKMAVAQAEAGFDILGPSDMMDGRIAAIRDALEEKGFVNTGIMSYCAKYASAFYGPFRDALDSAPKAGDKKTYQMDPANRIEAQRELQLDEVEGADYLMVKPALHYMDIISDLKQNSILPIVAYHVSGECAMLLAACKNGWLDFNTAMPETLNGLHRAGADIIISYLALDYAKWWRKQHDL
ncbi:porphobilinogen synthase [Luteibaculum oceani]|uniref:Delta-aminolevulinic acid dehydratase n=1 Tax=Luteibaculum oceani TaxID=1294296 RepID=A0A5C6V0K4_9FLAO|nr:porphobilinogen synthase [Luteibaculum oceani]TXC78464.1 porphobilinogen synthase [Luteibaculum oceani]